MSSFAWLRRALGTDTSASTRTSQSSPGRSRDCEEPDHEIVVNLGPCHFTSDELDPHEHATLMARKDGHVGWIPVCEGHRQRAVDGGYEVFEPPEPLVRDPRGEQE